MTRAGQTPRVPPTPMTQTETAGACPLLLHWPVSGASLAMATPEPFGWKCHFLWSHPPGNRPC